MVVHAVRARVGTTKYSANLNDAADDGGEATRVPAGLPSHCPDGPVQSTRIEGLIERHPTVWLCKKPLCEDRNGRRCRLKSRSQSRERVWRISRRPDRRLLA